MNKQDEMAALPNLQLAGNGTVNGCCLADFFANDRPALTGDAISGAL